MERLTGYDYIAGVKTGDLLVGADPQRAYDRLAAYEDTGLEPEDCMAYSDVLELRMYRRIGSISELRATKEKLQALGTVEKLSALVKAREEGRVVALPCKPSDVTVYQLRSKKHALGAGVSPRHISAATVWANGDYALHHQGADDCLKKDFGKTWFLTCTEAEAALSGGGRDG